MGDLGLCVLYGSCAPSWCRRILVSLNRTGEPNQHHGAQFSPELHRRRVVVAGASFCVSLDVGTNAHRMFFRSAFWQMEAVN